jgi:hypothetical protein
MFQSYLHRHTVHILLYSYKAYSTMNCRYTLIIFFMVAPLKEEGLQLHDSAYLHPKATLVE